MLKLTGLSTLLFCSLLAASFADTKPVQPNEMTVITFNLANYDDHALWPQRLKLIADEIQKAHADVVALQEVRFNPDHETSKNDYQNMAEQILLELNNRGEFLESFMVTQPVMYYPHSLTGKLGYHYYPLPARLAPDNQPYYWEGLSIISKRRIIETGNYFLTQSSDCDNDNRRVTQYAKIENGAKPIYIANIHFSGQACLKQNVKETLGFLQPFIKSAPVMILGDFNARPDNPVLNDFRKIGMTDVWYKLRPNEDGYTCATTGSPVKDQRIDFVWANAPITNKLTKPEQIWLIGNTPTGNLYPSDHYGLAVKYSG